MTMPNLIGQTIGNRKIEALLGVGGMGQVFRARHTNLDRLEALKVMNANVAGHPGFQARFLQEARAIAGLQHTNIVEIYDYSRHDQLYFLSMEYLDAGSLRALLERRSRESLTWPLIFSLDLIRQAADALAFAHAKSIVHRDIKPDNLLLERLRTAEGASAFTMKIGDFGLAQLAEGSGLTSTGMVVGTPHYMSPEQCQGEDLDGRSDIYSLGVVLYEVVTGYLPFAAKTISEATRKHVSEQPPPPRQLCPDLPTSVEEVILRCLAKQPAERFASARDLSDTLRELIRMLGKPVPVAPVGVPLVRLVDAGGQALRTSVLTEAGLTLGRLSGNDVVLDDATIGRNHLRIEWGTRRARVTDLGSKTGTQLNGVALTPHVPQSWSVGETLTIGVYTLRLELGEAPPERIGIAFAPGQETLVFTPGVPTMVQVTLTNNGSSADTLVLAVEGLPASWVRQPEYPIVLAPGARMALALSVAIPATPEGRVGLYPTMIRASSQTKPDEYAALRAHWSVAEWVGARLELSPPEAQGRVQAEYSVRLSNTGNVVARYRLSAEDADHALTYQFDRVEVEVAPGQSAEVGLVVLCDRRFFGATRRYAFTIRASASDCTCEVAGMFLQGALVSFYSHEQKR